MKVIDIQIQNFFFLTTSGSKFFNLSYSKFGFQIVINFIPKKFGITFGYCF